MLNNTSAKKLIHKYSLSLIILLVLSSISCLTIIKEPLDPVPNLPLISPKKTFVVFRKAMGYAKIDILYSCFSARTKKIYNKDLLRNLLRTTREGNEIRRNIAKSHFVLSIIKSNQKEAIVASAFEQKFFIFHMSLENGKWKIDFDHREWLMREDINIKNF